MPQHMGGRCQRGPRYCLWALGEATTQQILEYAYDWPATTRRQRQIRAQDVRRAAKRLAVKVGRRWPGGNVWRLKEDMASDDEH
jgi:hypothetical protein